MRAVIQRVLWASVSVGDEEICKIGRGILALVGFAKTDDQQDIRYMVKKIANLRIMDDERGRLNLSVKETDSEVLVVSQFTLYGDVRWGNRPSFEEACEYARAEELFHTFCDELSAELGRDVKKGRFGAMMNVTLLNHGPVTILIDSKRNF